MMNMIKSRFAISVVDTWMGGNSFRNGTYGNATILCASQCKCSSTQSPTRQTTSAPTQFTSALCSA